MPAGRLSTCMYIREFELYLTPRLGRTLQGTVAIATISLKTI